MRPESFSKQKLKSLKKIKIGILLGGNSPERAISIRSGEAVYKAFKSLKLNVVKIDPKKSKHFKKSLSSIDLVFVALHGIGGEDGEIQSVLESKKICYAGSSAFVSRISFNKASAKRKFRKFQIPTPSYKIISKKNWKKQTESFKVPYFVKPLKGGSSQGVFLVEDFKKSAEKIKRAIEKYNDILIEKAICGREVTVGILGNRILPVVEVKPRRKFYDYKAKYTAGETIYEVPAPISKKTTSHLQKLAWEVHKKLGLRDFCRVDFMLDSNDRPYVLEVNTIPGLTGLSLLPKAAIACGISFKTLCFESLCSAFKRMKKG